MALSKTSVDKAIAIFREINPDIQGEIGYYDRQPSDLQPADMIVGSGRKDDGGYESISTIIRCETLGDSKAIAERFGTLIQQHGIRNSSFVKTYDGHENAVRLGFY